MTIVEHLQSIVALAVEAQKQTDRKDDELLAILDLMSADIKAILKLIRERHP